MRPHPGSVNGDCCGYDAFTKVAGAVARHGLRQINGMPAARPRWVEEARHGRRGVPQGGQVSRAGIATGAASRLTAGSGHMVRCVINRVAKRNEYCECDGLLVMNEGVKTLETAETA